MNRTAKTLILVGLYSIAAILAIGWVLPMVYVLPESLKDLICTVVVAIGVSVGIFWLGQKAGLDD